MKTKPTNWIRERRSEAGLSQRDLGDKIGVSNVLISNWERERSSPNRAQQRELERVLEVGDLIREQRVAAGLSQQDLGEKIGVTQTTISLWERGCSHPNAAQRKELQRVLGLGAESGEGSPLATWVSEGRYRLKLSVPELAYKAGLTPVSIYRIEDGTTQNLREKTRKKLERALGASLSEDAAKEVAQEATIAGIGTLEDFDPHEAADRPSEPGIYVFYDISKRPIYVGQGGNVGRRIRDHEEKFWFKRPIVESASWIRVGSEELRTQFEKVLIKFLKSNAVINKDHVER